jgi:hypothetical protein
MWVAALLRPEPLLAIGGARSRPSRRQDKLDSCRCVKAQAKYLLSCFDAPGNGVASGSPMMLVISVTVLPPRSLGRS